MLHIDLSSKRARLALRFFTYGVMTLATVLLTMLAVFYAMGYRFNQSDLAFEQGGLLQFYSTPESAQVLVDGKSQNFTTPGRANFGAGAHTVEMRLNGYLPWQKTVNLAPGQVLWLNYARFVPNAINTSAAANFTSISSVMPSTDRKWMLLQEQSNQPLFKLIDFSDEKKPVITQLNIPETALTKKDDKFGTFTIKEWDLSSRYILVEHLNGDTREFIRLDRQHASTAVNVSRVFSLNITEAHFAGSNPNLFYAKTDAVLRSLDIGANSASAVLISGIEQFSVYGNDAIAFVASRNATEGDDKTRQHLAGLYVQGKETAVRTFAPDTKITIAYAEYARHAYFAVDSGGGVATIMRDPTAIGSKDNTTVSEVRLGKPIEWMKFSTSGRMLAVGSGGSVATYDLELDKLTNWQVPGATPTQPLQWLDDYYLWTDAGGTLRIFEFDGSNSHDIVSVTPGFTASVTQNNAYIYSFTKNNVSNVFELQGSQLIKN